MRAPRSWLYAPGHNERHLRRAFDWGADAVILDLEDAVPAQLKDRARLAVREVLQSHPEAWVRINRPRSPAAEKDLEVVGPFAAGIRVPKTESPDDVRWVSHRVPDHSLHCTIETARGLVNATEIALSPGCIGLVYGSADLAVDLGQRGGWEESLFARSSLVVSSRVAGRGGPVDGPFLNVDDLDGLKNEAAAAYRLGFSAKSAIHPRQVQSINDAFTPSPDDHEWAVQVLAAHEGSEGGAVALQDGSFVDQAIVERARRMLEFET